MTEQRVIEIYRAHNQWMLDLARKNVYCDEVAADIVSKVWVNVLLGKVKDQSHLRWNLVLYCSVMNGVKDHYKRSGRAMKYVEYVECREDGVEQPAYDFEPVIMKKLKKLCEGQRRVIELVILAGYNAPEAGKVLGISADTVRVQLHRGLIWLRKMVITS